TCVYFATDHAPFPEPLLVLNGTGRGLVNHVCVPSNVAPLYAPEGQSLISVNIVGSPHTDDVTLLEAVLKEMSVWFGQSVQQWRHLRTYHIEHALPDQAPPALSPPQRPERLTHAIFIAGDYRDNASIHGALVSGQRAAVSLVRFLAP
ncbi:MAG: FAD-dependent oxidoreductase, partial [Bacteroidota bacterium]|nr:FAD-dependent oxidoreductase [Candidatus Kapabacteria bacterium]MDW8221247.1 FAD-dependent oxidoreductase [Bacteroidota bacterium]